MTMRQIHQEVKCKPVLSVLVTTQF